MSSFTLVCCELNVAKVIKVVENLDDLTLEVLDSDIKGVRAFAQRGEGFKGQAEIQFFFPSKGA